MRRSHTWFVQIPWHLSWGAIAALLSLNIVNSVPISVAVGTAVYVAASYKEPGVIHLTKTAVVLRVGPFGVQRHEIAPAELRTDFESGFLTSTVIIRAKDRRRLGVFRELSYFENPVFSSSGLQRALGTMYGNRRERDLTDSSWKSTM